VFNVDVRRHSRNFFEQVDSPPGLGVLFDYLPDVYMFVKDRKGRFVKCNRAFVRLVHASREEDVLGTRDGDFFPRHLAENYTRDDNSVMLSGDPMIDKVELVRNPDGSINWYNTTKLPVRSRTGVVIGIAGITRDLKKMSSGHTRFLALAPVVETILSEYAQPLSVSSLAAKASLSVSQFDRQFRNKFQTTPRRYITNVRINAACELLVSTDLSISDIALETGFYDQSHFTNQFVRVKGMPPSHYRKRFLVRAPVRRPGAESLQ
jgi:PAS domain S-box-containing protein